MKQNECYTTYGMPRTGCPGCPFGQQFEHELEAITEFEPKLDKAVNHIFKDSFEWTRKYKEFQLEGKEKKKQDKLLAKEKENVSV